MSMDDRQKGNRKPPLTTATIATFVGAFIVILAAVMADVRQPLGRAFLNTLAATSLPTESGTAVTAPGIKVDMFSAQQSSLSPAIQTMDQYYRYINEARNSDDLGKAWDLLTINLKCNPSDRCNFIQYQDYWWQFRIQYKLYDCGSNTIDTEVIYYARKSSGPISLARADLTRYQLIDEKGQLKLNSGEAIDQVGATCKLAVSVP